MFDGHILVGFFSIYLHESLLYGLSLSHLDIFSNYNSRTNNITDFYLSLSNSILINAESEVKKGEMKVI